MAGPRPERLAALALLVAAPAGAQVADWRQVATREDRGRLREWRSAWTSALEGRDARDPLFDPDRSLTGSLPPAGGYRCRRVRPGRSLAGGWTACRIEAGEDGTRRLVLAGAEQRAHGVIYPDTDARAVFLGTWVMPDERRPIAYGRDARRNLPGVVERIGPARWRLALPYPGFGAVLELVEMVPAGATGAGAG